MTVHLVGAGPGDPGLFTLRGAQLLSSADVVVHDRLVDAAVLALSAPYARLVDVGKRAGGGSMSQDEINELLVEFGSTGVSVVRLKGGDPYVFGRGGEEAAALEAAGIDYDVTSGVSSISAVPAAAGVPLTMRGISSSFTVVTGHDLDALTSRISLDAIAAAETLVVFMGGAQRASVAERLLSAGRDPKTPVLVVQSGTTPAQHSTRSTLEHLAEVEVGSPTLLVIGQVAALSLSSYEQRPLFGWRVVVTRAEEQAGEFVRSLGDRGALAVELATIAIADPPDGGLALAEAAERVSEYDWVVFPSVNAVNRFFEKLPDARPLAMTKVAALGAATASALGRRGIVPDLIPERFVAEGLVEAFPEPGSSSRGVLVPRALEGGEALPEGIAAKGWDVDAVVAYQTIHPSVSAERLHALEGADAITFASSSAVRGFLEVAGPELLPPVVVTIGPVTSATARRYGIEVTVEAAEHTTGGMLDALVAYADGHDAERSGGFS